MGTPSASTSGVVQKLGIFQIIVLLDKPVTFHLSPFPSLVYCFSGNGDGQAVASGLMIR